MICDECETVAHCMKNGCVPKHQALERMAENARELGLDYEQPAQRTWFGLSDLDIDELENEYMKSAQTAHQFLRAIEAKLRAKNT